MKTFIFGSPTERREITDEERAAIDAFPAERIQRIPRGVSGLPCEGLMDVSWRSADVKAAIGRRVQRQAKFQRAAQRRASNV